MKCSCCGGEFEGLVLLREERLCVPCLADRHRGVATLICIYLLRQKQLRVDLSREEFNELLRQEAL